MYKSPALSSDEEEKQAGPLKRHFAQLAVWGEKKRCQA